MSGALGQVDWYTRLRHACRWQAYVRCRHVLACPGGRDSWQAPAIYASTAHQRRADTLFHSGANADSGEEEYDAPGHSDGDREDPDRRTAPLASIVQRS